MTGGLMQLVAYGAQDIYLTGNPMITYFKVVYRRHTNFAMESIEQTFNGAVGFGNRVTALISRSGDLINGVYLQATLPNIMENTASANRQSECRWVDDVGHHLIDQVDVDIGGQRIDRHYGDWLEIWAQLTVPAGKMVGYREMIGQDRSDALGQLTGLQGNVSGSGASTLYSNPGTAAAATIPGRTIYVPLQFWFCRNVGLSLPLIALQYHEVKISVLFKTRAKLIVNDASINNTPAALAASLWVDYIYLDTDERRRFAQVSHEYLIEQLQFPGADAGTSAATATKSLKLKLNFNHPVKELVWVVQYDEAVEAVANQWSNYTTARAGPNATTGTDFLDVANFSEFYPISSAASGSAGYLATDALTPTGSDPRIGDQRAIRPHNAKNPVVDAKLQLNGHDRFATREGTYFNWVQCYKHHTNIPESPGINVYSFALKPEEHQPSGTCNFSRIDNATLNLTIRDGRETDWTATATFVVRVYAVNYNVLRIMSGMGGLAYSN